MDSIGDPESIKIRWVVQQGRSFGERDGFGTFNMVSIWVFLNIGGSI